MDLDDIKTKISFELKDEKLVLGFEIICKHLLELEAENKELKKENDEFRNRLFN